jgi:hypothetical protein
MMDTANSSRIEELQTAMQDTASFAAAFFNQVLVPRTSGYVRLTHFLIF